MYATLWNSKTIITFTTVRVCLNFKTNRRRCKVSLCFVILRRWRISSFWGGLCFGYTLHTCFETTLRPLTSYTYAMHSCTHWQLGVHFSCMNLNYFTHEPVLLHFCPSHFITHFCVPSLNLNNYFCLCMCAYVYTVHVFWEDYVLVPHCIPALKQPFAHWLQIRTLCTVVHFSS